MSMAKRRSTPPRRRPERPPASRSPVGRRPAVDPTETDESPAPKPHLHPHRPETLAGTCPPPSRGGIAKTNPEGAHHPARPTLAGGLRFPVDARRPRCHRLASRCARSAAGFPCNRRLRASAGSLQPVESWPSSPSAPATGSPTTVRVTSRHKGRQGRRRHDGAGAGPNQGPSLVQFSLCIRHRFAGAGRLDA